MKVENVYRAYDELRLEAMGIWEAVTDKELAMSAAYADGALDMARRIIRLIEKEPSEEKPEPEKAKDKPKKRTTKKADLDMGKVKALREGGWSMEKIADEMGVSTATIYNRLKAEEDAGSEI